MNTLALVAVSARALAQAAARDGYGAVAIDLFGDRDTRRASRQWLPAGEPAHLRVSAAQVLSHLRGLAQRGEVQGWVAGGGCEGEPELLSQGARLLPLIGCAPAVVQRVRDPRAFFGWLDGHGLPHPECLFDVPRRLDGWLVKDARGCGGRHVQKAAEASAPLGPHHYFQRLVDGQPMSATFCANGSDALLVGFNQALRHAGGLPFAYGGVAGPVTLPPNAAAAVTNAVRLLGRELGLRGFGSLDFVVAGDDAYLLEVNPRPSASMALYGGRVAGGCMHAHVQACLHGQLPQLLAPGAGEPAVRGEYVVYAPRDLRLDAVASLGLQGRAECHDLPAGGTCMQRGEPVCTVSAGGPDVAAVTLALQARHDAVLNLIESLP